MCHCCVWEEKEIWEIAGAWIERDLCTLRRARIGVLIEAESVERKSVCTWIWTELGLLGTTNQWKGGCADGKESHNVGCKASHQKKGGDDGEEKTHVYCDRE